MSDAFEARIHRAIAEEMQAMTSEDLIVAALRTLSRPIRAEGYDGTRYVTLDLAESAARQARAAERERCATALDDAHMLAAARLLRALPAPAPQAPRGEYQHVDPELRAMQAKALADYAKGPPASGAGAGEQELAQEPRKEQAR